MNITSILSSIEEAPLQSHRLRFLLYCHDTFGLGHLRRTLSLAEHFTSALPNAEVLIVTGSPVAHTFSLPTRTDYVKLPVVTKQGNGTYKARDISLDFASILDLRAAILRETARAYHPDVFLVDHAPNGLKGEALPALTLLQATQPDCLRVLGLRDIIDASHIIRQNWAKEGIYRTLEYTYDRILVYGSPYLYNIGAEYGLSSTVSQQIHYCGYLDRLEDTHVNENEAQKDAYTPSLEYPHALCDRPLVVLTAGGGGDGFPLMQAYLIGLQRQSSVHFNSVLLAGPLMPREELRQLHELAANLPGDQVRIEKFLPDPLPLLNAADLVVAMAGYNTTCELLALRKRMLLIPRSVPRQEQLIRASILTQHGLAHMLHPERLAPLRLLDSVYNALEQPRPQQRQLDDADIIFHGQRTALEVIVDDLLHRHHDHLNSLVEAAKV